jgi:cell division protein FtsA
MAIMFHGGSKRPDVLGVLDIGTSKVCCVIAVMDDGVPSLLGVGHQRSRGVKSGMIVDADEAERAVRAAVGRAEVMAGVSLDKVVLAVACGRMRSESFTARAALAGEVVRAHDMSRILGGGEAYLERSGRTVVQLMRSLWRLDSASGIPDPRGLAGRDLAVDLTAVTADDGPVRNMLGIIERSHMVAERLVAAPYASALAVSTEDERRLGGLFVDLGAGLTSIAVFADGRLIHIDSVPVGGNHVTYDLAYALATSVQEAERIKTLHGTLVEASSNDGEVFAYPVVGEDEGAMHQTSKAFVQSIIKPRIDRLIDLVLERLIAAGLDQANIRRVVLTGGASQLLGLDQAWSDRFGCMVRIGRPPPIRQMSGAMCNPAFATAMGLMAIGTRSDHEVPNTRSMQTYQREHGYLDRMQRWIRESF